MSDQRKEDHCDCEHGHCECEQESCDCDQETIILTLEDDSEVECEVLSIFPFEEKEYIALLAVDDADGRILLYEFEESEKDDEVELSMIESEEEFDRVADYLDQLMEEEEDDLIDEDQDQE